MVNLAYFTHVLYADPSLDVVAVVKEIGSVTEITTKATGRQVMTSLLVLPTLTTGQIPKRELKIVDQSGFAINLTLWNKQAESFSADEENPIIAFKGVRVGDYGGRSLSMVASSMMMMNPDIPEAHNLRGWYDSSGSGQSFQAHARTDGGGAGGAVFNRSEMKALDDIKAVDVIDDNGASFCCQASVVHIKPERISYEACHTPGCSKKVNQEGDSWRCDKCNTLHDTPNHRCVVFNQGELHANVHFSYIMSFVASDWSNHLWLHGFNDVGEALFKMTANELMEIKVCHLYSLMISLSIANVLFCSLQMRSSSKSSCIKPCMSLTTLSSAPRWIATMSVSPLYDTDTLT